MSGLPTLEQITYDCPCEKQSVCKYKPHNSKDWPCALLIVIADANPIGKCNLLNWNDISVGIIGIRGMRTSSPMKGPVKIVASMMLVINFFTERCAPLQKLGLVDLHFHLHRFLDIKYIRPYSNKILSQNFKTIKRKKNDESRKKFSCKILVKRFKKENFLMDVFRWS